MTAYDRNNVFARILRGEIPCDKVYEDAHLLAFNDITPAAPVHILVIPRGEYRSFEDFTNKAGDETVVHFFRTIREIATEAGLTEDGYRLITNHGPNASQTVPHFHVHILGGRPLGGLVPDDRLTR